MPRYRAVLFDLDGTLADTAPDLAASLNLLRREEGLQDMPFEQIRAQVSNGSTALVRLGFDGDENAPDFERRRLRLLDIYRRHLCIDTRLFPGMSAVLDEIERRRRRWGIVTNKPGWLTDPLVSEMGLAGRAACVVSGDTLSRRKPHPDPLLHAAALAGVAPADCLYVGDAGRDVLAGRAAGMGTVVALYGYIVDGDDPQTWGADALIETPEEILPWVAPEAA
jgi:phosphoglycolate phosphatase